MKLLIRDTFIVWLLTFAAGFFVGLLQGIMSMPANKLVITIGLANFVMIILGGIIVGALKKSHRFKHLSMVTVLLWLASLLNVFLFKSSTISLWLLTLPIIFILLIIGGAISLLFAPNVSDQPL